MCVLPGTTIDDYFERLFFFFTPKQPQVTTLKGYIVFFFLCVCVTLSERLFCCVLPGTQPQLICLEVEGIDPLSSLSQEWPWPVKSGEKVGL